MTRRSVERRAGTISAATLVAIPVTLLLVGLVLHVGFLRDSRSESQNGADAAALAAARALATDDLLTNDRDRGLARVGRSRAAAVLLASSNIAAGERLTLDPNPNNLPDGALVFGALAGPSAEFLPAGSDADAFTGDRVNAVRVVVRRSPVKGVLGGSAPDRDVVARATAMLDWSVTGFRPADDNPIPLAPIGLFTDHAGQIPHGWDAHLRNPERDAWKFDPDSKRFVPGSDGIPEVTVVIGPRPRGSVEVPGVLVQVGADSFAGTVEQLRSGIGRRHLDRNFGGGFVLGRDNTIAVVGSPSCPTPGDAARAALDEALREIVASGQPRIWQLFSGVDENRDLVLVSGWVGARVVSAAATDEGGVHLVLQPAVICHPAAVTEHQRPSAPAFWGSNRTVCRVRLAE